MLDIGYSLFGISYFNIQYPTLNVQFPREEELALVVFLGCFDTAEEDGDQFVGFLEKRNKL